MTTPQLLPKAKPAPAPTAKPGPANSQRTKVPIWAHVPADAGQVMRDEKDDTPKAAESSESEPEKKKKKKSDISFGSAAVPWYVVKPLILKDNAMH